jgi:hypothetical protein
MLDSSNAPLVYEAADRWIEAALRTDDSLFTPGTPIWSESVIADLYSDFVENPDEGPRRFEEKFRDQLGGAAPETVQLAGELLFVHFLPALDMTGDHERRLIETVLSWSSRPVTIPSDLAAVLDQGFSTTGVAFRTRRPDQLTFLLEFLRQWKALAPGNQDRLLTDAWDFKEFVFALPIRRAQTQRAALLHLVHPDTFESITSEGMKQRIASAFSQPRLGLRRGPTGVAIPHPRAHWPSVAALEASERPGGQAMPSSAAFGTPSALFAHPPSFANPAFKPNLRKGCRHRHRSAPPLAPLFLA